MTLSLMSLAIEVEKMKAEMEKLQAQNKKLKAKVDGLNRSNYRDRPRGSTR